MTVAHFWQELVTTALLGTEQAPLALPLTGGPLDDVIARLDQGNPEQALLRAAALATVYRRAGQRPRCDNRPQPAPCALDDLPCCNRQVMYFVSMMIKGTYKAALPECLSLIAARGCLISQEALPGLLDAGTRDTGLRPLILNVVGSRGRWLAAQNDRWEYAAVADTLDESVWQRGTQASRVAFLRQVRAADSARGRDLVAAAWKEETPENRLEFLNVLIDMGLSMDDEPFLESLLDSNRRDKTRDTIRMALARLPESRLVQRMIARTRLLIRLSRHRKKGKIEVDLPQAYTDEMARDGIVREAHQGYGERAYWLHQMLHNVPLHLWVGELKATPLEIVRAAADSEWDKLLIDGWAAAAILQQNADWAEVILSLGRPDVNDRRELIKVLPPERIEAVVVHLIESTNHSLLDTKHPLIAILTALKTSWPDRLTRAVWPLIRESVIQMSADFYPLREEISRFGLCLMPSAELAAEADDLAYAVTDVFGWSKTMTEFAGLIRFRYEMYQELSK